MIRILDDDGQPMTLAQVAEYARVNRLPPAPGPDVPDRARDRWLRVVAAHVKAARVREARERQRTPEYRAAVMKQHRVREANDATVARWANELPELAELARGRAVSMAAAARRERLARRYPAFLCVQCGREERPADYVDPGQAGDLARRRCCWSCTSAEWLAPIARHPASENRDGVVWLGGVAVGLIATEAGPHEEEDGAQDHGGAQRASRAIM